MKRREFMTLLGGAAALAARARARSRRASFPPSEFSGRLRLRPGRHGPPLSCSGCASSAGSRAAMSQSSIAGRKAARALGRDRSRAGPAQGRCHRHGGHRGACAQASNIRHPDRVRDRARPGRRGSGHKPRAAGRQRHRPVDPGRRNSRQAARPAARSVPGVRKLAVLTEVFDPAAMLERAEAKRRPVSSGWRSSRSTSTAPTRISRPPWRPSRAAPMRSMSAPVGSSPQPGSDLRAGARHALARDQRLEISKPAA